MTLLITVQLIAFGVEGSGVEGRGASDIKGLILIGCKDLSVHVSWYRSWSDAERGGVTIRWRKTVVAVHVICVS